MKTSDEALCRGTCQNIKIPWAVLVGRRRRVEDSAHCAYKVEKET